ncbi:MAG: chromosomal replication initiator protein DnaA [Planctomycetota bacterium]
MSESAETLTQWKIVLDHIRELVSAQQFETWFKEMRVVELGQSRLVLALPNAFLRDWIKHHYLDVINRAVSHVLRASPTISLLVDPRLAPAPVDAPVAPPFPSTAALPMPAAPELFPKSDLVLNPAYTFENFVVGPGNQLSHAAALAVSANPGTTYNPFFLHGAVGLGKTHLLQAICHVAGTGRRPARILYLSCETFVNHFISAVEHGALESFRTRYRHADVLVIDDVHFLANKERTQEEFFHTFTALFQAGKQIILSSDCPPRDIPNMEDRLVSRFKWGLVTAMEPPDFETRVAIVSRKAKIRGYELTDEVCHFVADRVTTNVRELEGAVTKLLGCASLMGRDIDLDLAREALRDFSRSQTTSITIHDIVRAVTKRFGVKLSDLQSKKRTHSLAFPRQIAMYLAREHTTLSLEEIGGHFGGRDHTTVLYGADKVRCEMEKDPSLRELLSRLSNDLGK